MNKFVNLFTTQYHIFLVGLISVFVTSCTNSKPEETEKPTNVILLMGDDHGWEETAYNGHPFVKTPILDEMAATGLRLDHFCSASPVCSPTRGSVITGRHPNRYGTFTPNWSMRPEEISIAQIMGKAGYYNGHFGKWHLGPVKKESPTSPGAMGFDTWLSHDNFFEMNPTLSRDGAPPVQFQGEGSEILIDETIRFIAQAEKEGKPFFAVIWFGSPHEPYSGLDKDLALYDDLPDSLSNYFTRLTSMETGKAASRPLDSVLQERYAEITAMDRAIGKLRSHLKETGKRENTLLWYCGDNGIPASGVYNTSLRGQKGTVYEGGILVPGVIEWPAGISELTVSSVHSVTSDILPTLSELVGQPLPDRPLDGISMLPIISGEMKQRPNPIFFWDYETSHETKGDPEPYIDPALQKGTTPLVKMMDGEYTRSFRNFHHKEIKQEDFAGPKAVLDNQYKLVVNDQLGEKELFDIENDPLEKNNLIEQYPEVAEKLELELKQWQQSVLESLTGADYK